MFTCGSFAGGPLPTEASCTGTVIGGGGGRGAVVNHKLVTGGRCDDGADALLMATGHGNGHDGLVSAEATPPYGGTAQRTYCLAKTMTTGIECSIVLPPPTSSSSSRRQQAAAPIGDRDGELRRTEKGGLQVVLIDDGVDC